MPAIKDNCQKYPQSYFPRPTPPRRFQPAHHKWLLRDLTPHGAEPIFDGLLVRAPHPPNQINNPKLGLKIQVDSSACQSLNNRELNFAYNDHNLRH